MSYLINKKSDINKLSYDLENIDVEGMVKKIIDLFFEEKERRGLSNANLAEITGISNSYIRRLEKERNYNISVYVLVKLVAAMEIDIEDFWPEELKKTKSKTKYGENFEFIVQNLPAHQIEFLLDFVRLYSQKQSDVEVADELEIERKE